MRKDAAIDAARMMLQARAAEAPRLEQLAAAMKPWTRSDAIRHLEVKAAGSDLDRHPLSGLALKAQTNFLPLVLDVFGQSMKVDNYLSGAGNATAKPWQWWQRNKFDARQSGVHRAALHYGAAYVTVLPSLIDPTAPAAFLRGASPRQMTALYGEPLEWDPRVDEPVDDDWPIMALEVKGSMIRLYDEQAVHFIGARAVPESQFGWKDPMYSQASNFEYIEGRTHDVGVCPVVRFRDRMLLAGEEQWGIIEPLLSIQRRIDETTFEMLIAQYFSAFKQRYVMGWMPETEQAALKHAASNTWYFKEKDVSVGQFEATDLKNYLESKGSALRDLAAIGQVPAQNLGVDGISNISEAALAALETGKERKASEIETSFGESWEQVLRTAAHITGDTESAADFASEVKWRDATARSFAQTVDGLGKLSQMLDIPPEALWEDIPGWTRERVQRALAMATARDQLPEPDPAPNAAAGAEGQL
ncbi:phage portal protein [Rhodococcus sp. D2-41]|uniref:phage portal protein n=1 Tax=Speluncibacter jeojiensis TaxID=2710754 RepID=UPI002410771B|nr:phage portal protein [Rhodococcus sp. D2-41]MDG3012467.1 phage portal protein [Rhodococcus sp. D2-41]